MLLTSLESSMVTVNTLKPDKMTHKSLYVFSPWSILSNNRAEKFAKMVGAMCSILLNKADYYL